MCLVVLKPGRSADEQRLADQVTEAMGKALRPKAIRIVSDLPKTRSAKIVRRVIRAKLLGQSLGDLTSIENPAAIDEIAALSEGNNGKR